MVHSLTIFSSLFVSLVLSFGANGYVLNGADVQSAARNPTTGMLRLKLSAVTPDPDLVASPLESRDGEQEKRQNAAPFSQRESGNFYVIDGITSLLSLTSLRSL